MRSLTAILLVLLLPLPSAIAQTTDPVLWKQVEAMNRYQLRLYREIERLDGDVKRLRQQVKTLKAAPPPSTPEPKPEAQPAPAPKPTPPPTADPEWLVALFRSGTFQGSLVVTAVSENGPAKQPRAIAPEPRALLALRNHLHPEDLSLHFSFFLVNEAFNESLKKQRPAANPFVDLAVSIPGHLLHAGEPPIPLTLSIPHPIQASLTLTVPIKGFPGKMESGAITLTRFDDTTVAGNINALFENEKSGESLQVNLSFEAPLDHNPFLVGIQ